MHIKNGFILTFSFLLLSLVTGKGYNRVNQQIRDLPVNGIGSVKKEGTILSIEPLAVAKKYIFKQRRVIVFVTGPESTGNRYTVELIHRAAGCAGKSSHIQPLDHKARRKQKDWSTLDLRVLGMITRKNETQCAVLHRSFPHDNKFVDLDRMATIAKENGYDAQVIVLFRLMPAIIKSQIKRKHVNDAPQARRNIKRAYLEIFEDLARAKLPYTLVTYEFMEDKEYIDWLFQEIGLGYRAERIPPFHDENKKYFVHQHLNHNVITS